MLPIPHIDPTGEIIPVLVKGLLFWLCYEQCMSDWGLPDSPGCDLGPAGQVAQAYCGVKCLIGGKAKGPKKWPKKKKKKKKKGKEYGKNKKKKR